MGTSSRSATLVDLFSTSAARHGDRTAVSCGAESLSYRELDKRSDVLSRRLAAQGVHREDRVAVCLDRGADVAVAILGVLKSGACYVAVDDGYPDQRRNLMIEESGARFALCAPGTGGRIGGDCKPVEWHSAEPVDLAGVRPPGPPAPENAACVLFTSGSTGNPKGVVLEHRNLLAFALAEGLPALTPDDRTGQISSVSFDAFHFELWCTLARGAELVVLPALPDLLGADLNRQLRRNRITVLLVPTMAVNHVVTEDRNAFAPLRVLHTGGDVLSPAVCREILAGGFRGEFCNLYGPTEATTACAAYRIRDLPADADTVPIGSAIAGATLAVLDAAGTPVVAGEVGELFVGGAGVARGYLSQPAATTARFVPDPAAGGDARMYATGDLVRQHCDGPLEFIGRVDDQVKIRGYRVDPREVERSLSRCADVLDVAVVPAGTGEDRWLAALIVPYDTLTPQEIQAFAEDGLPPYLVPSLFLIVPEIPATANGKRDRKGMAELIAEARRRAAERVEPRTKTELYLVKLWEELLATETIGANEDFFALGGNSMLAFRVQRRLGRDLGVTVELGEVIDRAVLADLAAMIDGLLDGDAR
jgi:amino acid adenylation domain-containing protein